MNLEIRLGKEPEKALDILRVLASPLDYSIHEIEDRRIDAQVKPTPVRLNPENFVFLEAAKRGNYEYPDLMVSMYNLATEHIGDLSTKLDFIPKDTSKTSDGIPYIGMINHQQANDLVIGAGYYPLNLRLFADFLRMVREGAYENKDVFDAKGQKIKSERLRFIDEEITKVRSPYRGRWVSDKYEEREDGVYVSFYVMRNIVDEGLDEGTLMEDRIPGINMDSWIKNPVNQGNPNKKVTGGSLYYWMPGGGAVARFGADSDRAYLVCDWNPQFSFASLGVQFCAKGARFEN